MKTKELIAKADEQVKQYPQYMGAFEGAVRVVAKRNVRTKGGLVMTKGDEVLLPKSRFSDSPGFVTIWSFRRRCHVSVPASSVAIELGAS